MSPILHRSLAMIEMGIENSKSTTAAVGWLSYPLGSQLFDLFAHRFR
jgi:hypothetical protein